MIVRRTTSAALAALLAAAPTFAADLPSSWAPPTLRDSKITLIDAVRMTLENDPTLRVSELKSVQQRGAYQQQSGQFDPVLSGSGDVTFTQTALTFSQTTAEKKNRDDTTKDIADDQTKVNTAQAELTDLQKLAAHPDTYVVSQPGLIGIQLQVNAINSQLANTTDPAKIASLTAQRSLLIQGAVASSTSDLQSYQNQLSTDQTRLAKLGDVPTTQQDTTVDLSLDLKFPYRDGVTVGIFADGTYTASGYKGKEKKTEDGGLGVEDLYKYEVGFSIDASLLRGRGSDATGAFEKSAAIDYDASRFAFVHAATQSVFNTISAYWSLAAAQELLEVTKKSAMLHGKRLEVTKALIQGDEIPRAELSREMASQATDEAQVRSSERSVAEARLALARSMGIQVTAEAEAPLAADPLPEATDLAALSALAPAPLIEEALRNRADRRSAEKLRESGGVLVRAAETALRPRLDASGKISAGTVAETSFAKTANGWSAPSFSASLSYEQPIGNNEAKGRLLQQRADLAQRSIFAADLDRNIRANVVQAVATLQASALQLARAKDAVGLYGKTIDSEIEKFRAGQSSLLDSIVTQDLQTNALFTYTVARQQYATLMARLRFETGTLVTRQGERNVVRPGDLVSLPAVSK